MKFKLFINKYPMVICRTILPTDTEAEKIAKNKKQFINTRLSILTVFMEDNTQFTITAHRDYCFDGATIPFGIGKGNMKLLMPALFHDIMCENKHLVNNNRLLSSRIFKELLLMCGVPKWKASTMYHIVDNYQKIFGHWRKK